MAERAEPWKVQTWFTTLRLELCFQVYYRLTSVSLPINVKEKLWQVLKSNLLTGLTPKVASLPTAKKTPCDQFHYARPKKKHEKLEFLLPGITSYHTSSPKEECKLLMELQTAAVHMKKKERRSLKYGKSSPLIHRFYLTLFFCSFLTECSLQNIIVLVKWSFGSKTSYLLLCYGVPFSYVTTLHIVIRHYYNLYFPKKNNYYLNTVLFSECI